jgi:hypothetical protein
METYSRARIVDTKDIETRLLEAQNAMMEPNERPPRPGYFGFWFYGDAPPAIGGGEPAALWFEDKRAMLHFLRDHALFLSPARGDVDLTKSDAALRIAIANAEGGDLDILRQRLNELLSGIIQFDRIVSVEQLMKDHHPEAIVIRNHFRNESGQPETGEAIAEEHASKFLEFLGTYGVTQWG